MSPERALWVVLGLVLAVILLVAVSGCAYAGPCAPRDQAVQQLADEYGERQVAIALSRSGTLLELFAAPGGESWTLLETFPDGRTCGRGAGEFLELGPLPPEEEDL